MVGEVQIETKFKETEVGLIPEDWEILTVGDLFHFKNGLNKEKKYFGYGTPIVNYMDVYKLSGITKEDLSGKVFLSQHEIRNYEIKRGDVFFTRTSETVEEIGISSVLLENIEDGVFSGFVLRARPSKPLLEVEFCKFCFSSKIVRYQILTTASYTTRALTNGRLLSGIKIPIPPTKEEQTAIATALNDTDKLIAQLEKLIAKKQLIKQGAMQELLRPKEGWEEKQLGEICIKIQDGNYGESYPKSHEFVSIGVPFLTSKAIGNDGIIKIDLVDFITYEKHFQLAKAHLQLYDTLFTNRGASVGTIGIVDERIAAGNIGPQLTLLRADPKIVNPFYLFHIMKSGIVQTQIVGKDSGSAMNFFGIGQTMKFIIPLPILIEEQIRIATQLTNMDEEIESTKKVLEKIRMIKEGMMQNLLTGKIRLV